MGSKGCDGALIDNSLTELSFMLLGCQLSKLNGKELKLHVKSNSNKAQSNFPWVIRLICFSVHFLKKRKKNLSSFWFFFSRQIPNFNKKFS